MEAERQKMQALVDTYANDTLESARCYMETSANTSLPDPALGYPLSESEQSVAGAPSPST